METAWMAWTWQTGLFFALLASVLTIMTLLAIFKPETERVGVLRIPTTRGDRLFISLLCAAFIHIIWIYLMGNNPITTLPIGEEGFEVTSVWVATLISLGLAGGIFRWV
jgi:predicted small integral membrane protein